jgi:anti-sigma factor (TIGR02949 family)
MKSSCRALAPLVETYLDGELDPSQLLQVEAHTRLCPTCAERVMLDRAIRGSVRRCVSETKASPELHARVAAAITAESATGPRADAGPSSMSNVRSIGGWLLVAAAAAAALPLWLLARSRAASDTSVAVEQVPTKAASMDTVIDQLVEWHAQPLPPEVTDVRELTTFEPYVGVPVQAPTRWPFGVRWIGARMFRVDQRVTAILQYSTQDGHRVSVYVYDPQRIHVRPSSLMPRVLGNEPVYVGHVRGYAFAAAERRGVGYAVASDLSDDDSAEVALHAWR